MSKHGLAAAIAAGLLLAASTGCFTLVGAGVGLASSSKAREVAPAEARQLRRGSTVTVSLGNGALVTGRYRGYYPAEARILVRNAAGDHLLGLDTVRSVRVHGASHVAEGAFIGLLVDVAATILLVKAADEFFDGW